ncbi:unnamed protein product [Lactuca virosa]|uniref:Late embryogenesis abundant protein LEA-2 subgroup domain-containing protein n=1 Tax=Lactuca virosa TaxID=75947 RepID=A0AAU9MCA4_9ASTR|nr:unnamed protein product [Lactuca virosa]
MSVVGFDLGNESLPGKCVLMFSLMMSQNAGTFIVDVQYADVSELQAPPKISKYTIGPFQTTKGERAKVKVKARLNLHGNVSVESAHVVIEEDEVEVPVTKETSKIDLDKAPTKINVKCRMPMWVENVAIAIGDNWR